MNIARVHEAAMRKVAYRVYGSGPQDPPKPVTVAAPVKEELGDTYTADNVQGRDQYTADLERRQRMLEGVTKQRVESQWRQGQGVANDPLSDDVGYGEMSPTGSYINYDQAARAGAIQTHKQSGWVNKTWNWFRNIPNWFSDDDVRYDDLNHDRVNTNSGAVINLNGNHDITNWFGLGGGPKYRVREAGSFGRAPKGYAPGDQIRSDKKGNESWSSGGSEQGSGSRVTARDVMWDHQNRVDSLMDMAGYGNNPNANRMFRIQMSELFNDIINARQDPMNYTLDRGFSDEYRQQLMSDPRFLELVAQSRANGHGRREPVQIMNALLGEAANAAWGLEGASNFTPMKRRKHQSAPTSLYWNGSR